MVASPITESWSWTAGTGMPDASTTVVDESVLLALALAYHSAQSGSSMAAEAASRDLLLRLRPVNNADLERWMAAYNVLLAAAQRQQAMLTLAYIKATLALYDVQDTALRIVADTRLAEDLIALAEGDTWRHAPSGLRNEVRQAAIRLGAGGASLDDHLLADRAFNLASPVVKVRTELAGGAKLVEAVDKVAPEVETMTDASLRAAERWTMQHVNWPSFKDGRAMVYKRLITPGACGWCRLVATRLYPAVPGRMDGAAATWHRGCRCTWKLISYSEATSYDRARKEGDYYDGARAIGLWQGDAPDSYLDYIASVRSTDGSDGFALP